MGNRRNRKGYVLIATCAGLAVLIGIAGMAVDVGRLYIAKSEVQSFADSAAVAAALQLDGTSAGIVRAEAAITNTASGTNAMKWDMATKTVSSYSVTFAQGLPSSPNTIDSTTWSADPADPANYRFAKVTAGVSVPLTFIRVFRGLTRGASASSQDVNVTGTAGQELLLTVPHGLLPFSPIAPDATNANGHYGFNAGTQYTMRYPPPGKRNSSNVCPGDQGGTYWTSLPGALRGDFIYDQQTQPITLGQPVPLVEDELLVEDEKTVGAAVDLRVSEDSDTTSSTYGQYMQNGRGNNRRIVALPINGGPDDFTAIAIGAFFLLQEGWYSNAGNGSLCAEYIGPYVQGSPYAGGGAANPSGFLVRLVR